MASPFLMIKSQQKNETNFQKEHKTETAKNVPFIDSCGDISSQPISRYRKHPKDVTEFVSTVIVRMKNVDRVKADPTRNMSKWVSGVERT